MMKTLFLLGLVASHAAAATINKRVPEPVALPQPVGELGWEGSVTSGGPVLKYWGRDLDDIEAKIKRDYPDLPITQDGVEERGEPSPVAAREVLHERQLTPGRPVCSDRYGLASYRVILAEARRLTASTAICRVNPRTCARVGCRDNAAIGICNDSAVVVSIPCSSAAPLAQDLAFQCRAGDETGGQIITQPNTWSVVIGSCDNI